MIKLSVRDFNTQSNTLIESLLQIASHNGVTQKLSAGLLQHFLLIGWSDKGPVKWNSTNFLFEIQQLKFVSNSGKTLTTFQRKKNNFDMEIDDK